MSAGADSPAHGWRMAALLCAIALLWLTTRLYFGTAFDARYYMAEALNALDPARFTDDLFFQFGSQGNFSLFPWLYRPFLLLFGVGSTGMILTAAGQLLWLSGLFCLTRVLAGERAMWLSMAVVICMQNVYPGSFSYGDSYLTARLFSEAFVMHALAQLTAHPLRTWALLAVAAALHPLMALPGVGIALVYLALGRPIWWAMMAAGAALAAALGLAGIAPFYNLFRTIDPEWLAIINLRTSYCFVGNWPVAYFILAAGTVVSTVAALVLIDGSHRRFLTAVLIVGIGGVVCTYLGGDIARNVLIVELQPWRSMWLLQLVSRICVPLVLMALIARVAKPQFDKFAWATLATMGLILASSVARVLHNPTAVDFSLVSLAFLIPALALMAANLLLTDRHLRVVLISAVAGFALIPLALMRWDSRSPWIRYVEAPEPPPRDLAALLPEGASVYWESGLEMLWFRLKRSSYFSRDQGVGALFYRDTAMAYQSRAVSFSPLGVGDLNEIETSAIMGKPPKPARNRAGLLALCRREKGLDYVVLTQPLDGVTPKVWKAPVLFQDMQSSDGTFYTPVADRFYIYSCAPMR